METFRVYVIEPGPGKVVQRVRDKVTEEDLVRWIGYSFTILTQVMLSPVPKCWVVCTLACWLPTVAYQTWRMGQKEANITNNGSFHCLCQPSGIDRPTSNFVVA